MVAQLAISAGVCSSTTLDDCGSRNPNDAASLNQCDPHRFAVDTECTGDSAHRDATAVQQHPRWGLVDVLRGRYQRDSGVLEREVDCHVVGTVAGEPVDLVDDAVVRLVLGDVLDHPHQFGPVRLACRFARVDELLDDRRAKLVGFALVRGFKSRLRETKDHYPRTFVP